MFSKEALEDLHFFTYVPGARLRDNGPFTYKTPIDRITLHWKPKRRFEWGNFKLGWSVPKPTVINYPRLKIAGEKSKKGSDITTVTWLLSDPCERLLKQLHKHNGVDLEIV